MPHKTIHHVLTQRAGETSLAGCLAARDNRLPVEGERRPCPAGSLQLVYTCVSLTPCANVTREEGLGLLRLCSTEMTVLSHFFPLTRRVLLNTRNVIWRCCSDRFLLQGGKLFKHAWSSSAVFFTYSVTEESLYFKEHFLLCLLMSQKKKMIFWVKNWE